MGRSVRQCTNRAHAETGSQRGVWGSGYVLQRTATATTRSDGSISDANSSTAAANTRGERAWERLQRVHPGSLALPLSLSTSIFAFIFHFLSAGERTYRVVITLASTASVYAPTCANPTPFRASITGEVAGLRITKPERSGQCVALGVPLNVSSVRSTAFSYNINMESTAPQNTRKISGENVTDTPFSLGVEREYG